MVPSTAPHPGLGQAGCFTLIQGIPFITLHGVPAGPCQGPSSLSPHFLLCPVVTSPCRQGKLSNREEEEEYLGFVFLSATGAGEVQSQTGPELCSSPKSSSHLQPQIPVPAAPSSSSQLSTPRSLFPAPYSQWLSLHKLCFSNSQAAAPEPLQRAQGQMKGKEESPPRAAPGSRSRDSKLCSHIDSEGLCTGAGVVLCQALLTARFGVTESLWCSHRGLLHRETSGEKDGVCRGTGTMQRLFQGEEINEANTQWMVK